MDTDKDKTKMDTDKDKTKEELTIEKNVSQISFSLTYGPGDGYKMTLDILNKIKADLLKIHKINIKELGSLEHMISVLKLCLVVEDREFKYLFEVPSDKRVSYDPNNLREISSLTCHILEKIITKVDKSKAYTILESLILAGPRSFSFEQLFKEPKKNGIHLHPGLAYTEIFSLFKTAIDCSKNTLSLAESKPLHGKNVAFTPLSSKIAKMLDSTITLLIELLAGQANINYFKNHAPFCHKAAFRLLHSLVDTCPFHRLDSSLFKSITNFVANRLAERPQYYTRESYLPLTLSIVSQEGKSSEDLGLLTNLVLTLKTPGIYSSLIVAKSIQSLLYWKSGIELRTVYLQERNALAKYDVNILIQLCKNHFTLFKSDVFICMRFFIETIKQAKEFEKLLGEGVYTKNGIPVDSKQMVEYMVIYKSLFTLFEQTTIKTSDLIKASTDMNMIQKYITSFVHVWENYLEEVPKLLLMNCDILAPSIADCNAAMGEELYLHMPHHCRVTYMDIVFRMAKDPRIDVQAKMGRAIANILSFSFILWNPKSTLFCLEVIEGALLSSNISVRTSYAWALGNLVDSMGLFCKYEFPMFMKIDFVDRLFAAAFKCVKDKPCIRYNGHRTIGLLLRWIPDELLTSSSVEDNIVEAIDHLTSQINTGNDIKSRWNASYALGCVFSNKGLIDEYPNILDTILDAMSKAACESKVFKEKIQCLKNLGVLTRELYGPEYFTVWQRTLMALAIPDDIQPKEWTHIDKLRLEGSKTVGKLISCMESKDLASLGELFTENQIHLKKIIKYGITHLGPIESIVMENALERVDVMRIKAANSEEKEISQMLRDCFRYD